MTYKEKKLNELKESYKKAYKDILPEEVLEKGNSWYENFLSSTIDEIMTCLPEKLTYYTTLTQDEWHQRGYNNCREDFLKNLDQKYD